MKLDFCVSYNYTQRDLFLPPPPPSRSSRRRHHHHHQHHHNRHQHHHHHNSAEIPPKIRYKQKQNEIQYENSTHFIRLPLSKVETPPLQYYTTHQKTP